MWKRIHDGDVPFADPEQKTHWREALSMSLLSQILATGQPSPTCSDSARKRGYTWRFPCGHEHAISTPNSNRSSTTTGRHAAPFEYHEQPRWPQSGPQPQSVSLEYWFDGLEHRSPGGCSPQASSFGHSERPIQACHDVCRQLQPSYRKSQSAVCILSSVAYRV